MIQRVQSIYLLLVTISLGLLFMFPVWHAKMPIMELAFEFSILDYELLMFLTGATATAAFISIFLFGKRPLQARIALITTFMSLAIYGQIYFYTMQMDNPFSVLMEVSVQPGAFMPLLGIAFSFLAYRAVNRDEKLVRSMDRLR